MIKEIEIGSDFSGVGAVNYSFKRIGVNYKSIFACDMDKFARKSFIAAHGNKKDLKLLESENVKKIDSVYYREFIDKNAKKPTKEEWDFVNKIEEETAKLFSFYYPWNVYKRVIPLKSLGCYITTPPCQSFSMVGKRGGKKDKRGILFFNSLEFIRENKPESFVFENVEGLLSDDNGKTFQEWIIFLGGKSVNGIPVIFPYDESVPYHIFYKVINAKKQGVPQNRKRIFIIGFRDDVCSNFQFPKEEPLVKKLKDVLETFEKSDFKNIEDFNNYMEKYFLSEKIIGSLLKHGERHKEKGNGFSFSPSDINKEARSITTKAGSRNTDNFIEIKYATSKGYELATENDSINFSVPSSETRRGRVGKEVAQALDTQCNQSVLIGTWRTHEDGKGFRKTKDNNCPTISARAREDGSGQQVILKDCIFRRLTPKECFELMDFPKKHVEICIGVGISDSQLYKQAGNSIVVGVLVQLIEKILNILNVNNE